LRTKSEEQSKIVINALLVYKTQPQIKLELPVLLWLAQHAHVPKYTLKMDTNAFPANLAKFQMLQEPDVLMHHHALVPDNTSVMPPTVTNADNAK
jgi:hypothetical protein